MLNPSCVLAPPLPDSAIISSEVHRRKKKTSPQTIKYDKGRSEDEFEIVIAAYLHVELAHVDYSVRSLCVHFVFLCLTTPTHAGTVGTTHTYATEEIVSH